MTQTRERKDFLQVRLSAAGLAFAGKGEQLRVATLHIHYLFTGQAPQEVLTGEWRVLSAECNAEGEPLFEQVPAVDLPNAAPVLPQSVQGAN